MCNQQVIFTMEQDPTAPTELKPFMLYGAPSAPNTCCKGTKCPCPCANTRCEKTIHELCYCHFVYDILEVKTELVSPHTKEHLVVCSRTCYNNVLRNFSTMVMGIPFRLEGRALLPSVPSGGKGIWQIMMRILVPQHSHHRPRTKSTKGTCEEQEESIGHGRRGM